MGASTSAHCLGAESGGETKPLKSPGQFERLHDEVKKVTSVNPFEGAKFEVAKPLTPTFALNHNFWLGGSYYPNANQHYKFGATVGDNERVCMASVDQRARSVRPSFAPSVRRAAAPSRRGLWADDDARPPI